MTAYLMTEEQHAQIVDALDTVEALFTSMDIQHLLAYREVESALAMLKAMKPSNPSAWLACDKEGNVGCSTKENHALRCCEAGTKAEPLYALGDTA